MALTVPFAKLARAVLAALAATIAASAGAHSQLDRSVPAAGSTVHATPPNVALWFSARLEPAFSKLRVLDRHGKQVDKRDPQLDRVDRKLLRVSLPVLAPGAYRVNWRVLSVDNHVVEGSFTFSVAP